MQIEISFRKEIKEIPSTTYGVFSLYRYPSKFIPQVVYFVLKKYGSRGVIFDPFAGAGTVGYIARIFRNDYILWDLNPILEYIHKTATIKPMVVDIKKIIDNIKQSKDSFFPQFLSFWFPQEFIPLISKAWGYYHFSADEDIKKLILIPLFKVSKYFSYADEKVYKLFRSRYSREKIKKLLSTNWELVFYEMLEKEIYAIIKKLNEYRILRPKEVNYIVRGGIDSLNEKLDTEVDILVTSPPYLHAREYIRSTKLELFLLGYDKEKIRLLSKKEIPYRDVEKIKIFSETYYKIYNNLTKKYAKVFSNYFNAILKIFQNLSENVKNYLCIFIGRPHLRGIEIPTDLIISEHITELGWKHIATYIDTITSHALFKVNINPATKRPSPRMQKEYLLIFKNKK